MAGADYSREMMRLKDAVELYKKEEHSPHNSYDWYRRSASRSRKVSIGSADIGAFKEKGAWHVDDEEFHNAIKKHREEIEKRKKLTEDYSNGIIHGKDGDTIQLEGGGYRIHGNFRFVWSHHDVLTRRSDGNWYCNKCNTSANTEHNKEECHVCSDWNGCGRDCTLSRVFCLECGSSIGL